MDYKELDIWEASVFDFTDDPIILRQIVGNITKVDYFYRCHYINRLQDILKYASIIEDHRLMTLATKATAKAWREWSKMAKEAQKQGIIID